MTIFVDALMDHGWQLGGRSTRNCHLFTDEQSLDALHAFAQSIGMSRSWFQDKAKAPHYDLTPQRRSLAIAKGAVAVGRREAVAIWKARRTGVESAIPERVDAHSANSSQAHDLVEAVLEPHQPPRTSPC